MILLPRFKHMGTQQPNAKEYEAFYAFQFEMALLFGGLFEAFALYFTLSGLMEEGGSVVECLGRIWGTVGETPAVGVVGWDAVMCGVSYAVYWVRKGLV